MHEQRSTKDVNVNVKVKATPPEDLTKILAGIREDYEAIIEKNLRGLDVWYKEQVTESYTNFLLIILTDCLFL